MKYKIITAGILVVAFILGLFGVDFVSDKRRDQGNIALGKAMQSRTNGDQTLPLYYKKQFKISHYPVIAYVCGAAGLMGEGVDVKRKIPQIPA